MDKKAYMHTAKYPNCTIGFPVMEVQGSAPGRTLCITAGVHGCEYGGISAAQALYCSLDPTFIAGRIIIIPIVDLQTFCSKKMFTNINDDKDVNRVFPGNKTGTYSEKLVHELYLNYISQSEIYIDLHSGDLTEDMIPFIELHENKDKKLMQETVETAKLYGIKDIVMKNLRDDINDKNQSYSTASEAGIISFVANAGVTYDLNGSTAIHLRGLTAIVNALFSTRPQDKKTLSQYRYYGHPIHVRSKQKGLFYSQTKSEQIVKKGEKIGELRDIFGSKLEDIIAPSDGKVLLLSTALPVNENSLLCEIIKEK